MKYKIFLIILVWLIEGCKKNDSANLTSNNNIVNATVQLSNATVVSINAKGIKAPMGLSSPLGGGGYINGTSGTNAAVYLSFSPSITTVGTFDCANGFSCQYRQNVTSNSTPIFTSSSSDPGYIIFTAVSNNQLEGRFYAICRYNGDSVSVNGTFSGNIIGH